jgi:thiol-disulfide isomerase/thioredoxin
MKLCIFLLGSLYLIPTYSQSTSQINKSFEVIIQKYNEQVKERDYYSFSATLSSKLNHQKDFTHKTFKVSAKYNPIDKLYGYDWLIREYDERGDIEMIYKEDYSFLVFHKVNNIILKSVEGQRGNLNYSEGKRWQLLADELLHGISLRKDIKLNSGLSTTKHWFIEVPINEFETKYVWIDKISYLPTKIKHERTQGSFNQILITTIDKWHNEVVQDSLFDLQSRYPDYKLIIPDHQKPEITSLELEISDKQIKKMLNWPIWDHNFDTTSISKQEGKLFLIDFWFTSCAPCLAKIPVLNELHKKYESLGLKVIGLNPYDGENAPYVNQKLLEAGGNYPNFFSERTLSNFLGIRAFPSIILLNEKKELLYAGFWPFDNWLEKQIKTHLDID